MCRRPMPFQGCRACAAVPCRSRGVGHVPPSHAAPHATRNRHGTAAHALRLEETGMGRRHMPYDWTCKRTNAGKECLHCGGIVNQLLTSSAKPAFPTFVVESEEKSKPAPETRRSEDGLAEQQPRSEHVRAPLLTAVLRIC